MHFASHSPHACQLTSLSHAVTVTWPFCDFGHTFLWLCDYHVIFPTLHLSNNLKEKERKRKRNINIDLAILPSHDSQQMQGWAKNTG